MSAAITDTTATAVVQASHVSRSFQRGSESIHVLEDLSLEVKAGEFLALMGPSGSGKSTLLNLIGGLDRPTGGSITVAGERLYTLPESAAPARPGARGTWAWCFSSTICCRC